MKTTEINHYYEALATNYDENRFGNSYGNYIDAQERKILNRYINTNKEVPSIDIACGTGRLLNYASHGLDASKNMLKEAKKKHLNKKIMHRSYAATGLEENSMEHAISFHLLMHLQKEEIPVFLNEMHRILKKDGILIIDFPSEKRRKWTNYKAKDWHGANAIQTKTLKKLLGEQWQLKAYHGIGFFPIHRIPKKLRSYFVTLDNVFANSFCKEWSSYLVYILQKT